MTPIVSSVSDLVLRFLRCQNEKSADAICKLGMC